ncbi:MAG: hypothetical protein CO189_00395 [candidate division Zixibacteria bacterium CG_4_9_14_3_um_filter_46_8]|nr:MAG: hypothetical protein CO189_00395 [candidate division Zixibacteria bacterium CG_4_9_14_3_um_filter_46_8]
MALGRKRGGGEVTLHKALEVLALVTRVALGVIFVYASIDKAIHPAEFAKIIHYYRILPGFLINLWAITLPWIELTCGLLLILGWYREGALTILTVLLVTFMIAIGVNIIRGVDLNCGCFTVSESARSNAWSVFIRDSWLLAMAFFVFFFDRTAYGLDRFRAPKGISS